VHLQSADNGARNWWRAGRKFSPAEILADGIIHLIGILAAVVAGSWLLSIALLKTAPAEAGAIALYVATLVAVLSVSLAYNLWPPSSIKQTLARLDQAAIFLFIAGTYTPFLTVLGEAMSGKIMMMLVWSGALGGVALKLLAPHRLGRLSILLYLAIGFSGVLIFQRLAASLPAASLWLIIAGSFTYVVGIVFHLWEKMRFQTAVWHLFVVVAAMLHFVAVLDCMVISRL
jgi:hemolysin III